MVLSLHIPVQVLSLAPDNIYSGLRPQSLWKKHNPIVIAFTCPIVNACQILLALRLWPFNPVCHHHHCLLLVHATCPICLWSTISSLCILCTSIIYANIIPYMIHSGQSQGSWTAAHIAINICVPSQGLYLMICPQFQRLMLILITLSLIMQISCWAMLESSMKQGNQEAQQLKSQTEASDDRFRPAVGCRWAACVMSARAQATGVCNSTLQWHSESV